jgi:hypothetical protein
MHPSLLAQVAAAKNDELRRDAARARRVSAARASRSWPLRLGRKSAARSETQPQGARTTIPPRARAAIAGARFEKR